jgi:subtilisin family serine protease
MRRLLPLLALILLTGSTWKNWGLDNDQAKSHVSAECAWREERPLRDVVVAVIDTGVDPDHPDLHGKLWCDPKVTGTCQYGWNFVTNTPNPKDEHGHGTHVAGIIGAKLNEYTGTAGIASRVRIMAIKYYSDAATGAVNLRRSVEAVDYAVQHGAQIINYSGGGPEFSEEEYLALKKAEAKGILIVAAAGNEHQDTDLVENYYYPSAYRLTNIISVAATDIRNNLLRSSNWGRSKVDVAAPGENIYSTLPGGRYGYMSGTSQATAFVTGIAAMVLAGSPAASPAEIINAILVSVDKLPQLDSKVVTGGRVNACQAVLAGQKRLKKCPALSCCAW